MMRLGCVFGCDIGSPKLSGIIRNDRLVAKGIDVLALFSVQAQCSVCVWLMNAVVETRGVGGGWEASYLSMANFLSLVSSVL